MPTERLTPTQVLIEAVFNVIDATGASIEVPPLVERAVHELAEALLAWRRANAQWEPFTAPEMPDVQLDY